MELTRDEKKKYKEKLQKLENELAAKQQALGKVANDYINYEEQHKDDLINRPTFERFDEIILNEPKGSPRYMEMQEAVNNVAGEWNSKMPEKIDPVKFLDEYRNDLLLRIQLENIDNIMKSRGRKGSKSYNDAFDTVNLTLGRMYSTRDKKKEPIDDTVPITYKMKLSEAMEYTAEKMQPYFNNMINNFMKYEFDETVETYANTVDSACKAINADIAKRRANFNKYLSFNRFVRDGKLIRNEHQDALTQAEQDVEAARREISELKARREYREAFNQSAKEDLAKRSNVTVKKAYSDASETKSGEYRGKPAGIYILSKFTGYDIKPGLEEGTYKRILSNVYLNGKPILSKMGNIFEQVEDPYKAAEIVGDEMLRVAGELRNPENEIGSMAYQPFGERPVFSIKNGESFIPVIFDRDEVQGEGMYTKNIFQMFRDAGYKEEDLPKVTSTDRAIRLAEYDDINEHSRRLSAALTKAAQAENNYFKQHTDLSAEEKKKIHENYTERAIAETQNSMKELRATGNGYNYIMKRNAESEKNIQNVFKAGSEARVARWLDDAKKQAKKMEQEFKEEQKKQAKKEKEEQKKQAKKEKEEQKKQAKKEKEEQKKQAKKEAEAGSKETAVKEEKAKDDTHGKAKKISLFTLTKRKNGESKDGVKAQEAKAEVKQDIKETPKAAAEPQKTPEQLAAERALAEKQAFEQEVEKRYNARIKDAINAAYDDWKKQRRSETIDNYTRILEENVAKKARLEANLDKLSTAGLPENKFSTDGKTIDTLTFDSIVRAKRQFDALVEKAGKTPNGNENNELNNQIAQKSRELNAMIKPIQDIMDKAAKHFNENRENSATPITGDPCKLIDFLDAESRYMNVRDINLKRLAGKYAVSQNGKKFSANVEQELSNIHKAMKENRLDAYRETVDEEQKVLIDKLRYIKDIDKTLEAREALYQKEANPSFMDKIKRTWNEKFHPERIPNVQGTADFLTSMETKSQAAVRRKMAQIAAEDSYKKPYEYIQSCMKYCREAEDLCKEDIRRTDIDIRAYTRWLKDDFLDDLTKRDLEPQKEEIKTKVEADLKKAIIDEVTAEREGRTNKKPEAQNEAKANTHSRHRHHHREQTENAEETKKTSETKSKKSGLTQPVSKESKPLEMAGRTK